MNTGFGRNRGFTLLELVVTIAISGIVVVFVGLFIKAPIDAYMMSASQSELQDSISIAWPRMESDIHSALPNSVRKTSNGNLELLELLPVVDSARFMAAPSASFRTAGYFRRGTAGIFMAVDNDPNDPLSPGDAYDSTTKVMTTAANVITLAGTPADQALGEDSIQISGAVNLHPTSPRNHIYLVTKPVTYLCDKSAGTLQRFSNYSVATLQSSVNTAAKLLARGATSSLVARNLTSCTFSPVAGSAAASQIVTIQMTATLNGETTSLYQIVAVDPLQ